MATNTSSISITRLASTSDRPEHFIGMHFMNPVPLMGLVELIRASHNATVGVCGLDDTLESIREEMRRFADSEVIGDAQTWHRTNSYIPLEIIA